MPRLALSLLGPFRAFLDGVPIKGFESDKVRALLAYPAVEAGVPHRRAALAGLLWPDWPDAAAMSNLRNALSALRRAIGEREAPSPLLIADRETVQFSLTADSWVDVAAFQHLTAERRARTPNSDLNGRRSATATADLPLADLESAVALCSGPFLEGFSLGDSAAFEEWALLTREQLERQCLAALDRLVGGYEQGGDLARACQFAWRAVDLAPWEEEGHRRLMRLLSPREILEQLTVASLDFLNGGWQDMPERQRGLRAVFDHSWRLLSEGERQAFAQLSVFRGGFTYPAAQQVCGVTLRDLMRLVDCSLLSRAPNGRYEMHELLRRYAEEKLASEPDQDQAVRDRHAAYWIAALAGWAPALKGPRQIDALAEMDAEIANVQVAWAVSRGAVAQLADGMEALGHEQVTTATSAASTCWRASCTGCAIAVVTCS